MQNPAQYKMPATIPHQNHTTPDGVDLARAARELVPTLKERGRATEQLRRVPDETVADLQSAGLFKLLQPACFGGYETDIATFQNVVMTLAAADGSVGWIYSVLSVQTWMLGLMNPRASEEVWGTDPTTLTCSASPATGYIDKVADGYRLSGRFGFSSGCHHAKWLFVFGLARNAPEDGLQGFLVPGSDFRIEDTWHTMGLCGTGSCDVMVDSLVPGYRTHPMAKYGSQLSDASLYKLPGMIMYSHAPTLPVVGMAQGALDEYITSQRDRVNIVGVKISTDPATQIRVSESSADIDAARLAIDCNFADMTRLATDGVPYPPELLTRVDRDQILGIRRAVTAVDRLFASTGARALNLDNPIQRTWRDVHAGAAHPVSLPDYRLPAYGARAFGIPAASD
jgi:3-hydroxy-9,10-secoandrosta-1,3,5(10)-triene-9,17-dione monooxygenase